MAIFTASAGTSVEPLAIIKEGQVAGATIRVPLNCIDLCRVNTRETLKSCTEQQRKSVFVFFWSYACELF